MKAALNSLGIMRGRYQFAQNALAEKTLINPLPAIDATASYYLVCRKILISDKDIKPFVNGC